MNPLPLPDLAPHPSSTTSYEQSSLPHAQRQSRPLVTVLPKRNRPQLSCTHCRHAKLKCDRQQPCDQCKKRDKTASCTFPTPAARRKPAASMQTRLKHLESLVKDVMNGQTSIGQATPLSDDINSRPEAVSQDPLTLPQDEADSPKSGAPQSWRPHQPTDPSSASSGKVLLGNKEASYIGATHWAAILDDIEEMKGYFDTPESEELNWNENASPDTFLIFNSKTSADKHDLLAALPRRAIVDGLISRYFNSNSPGTYITHKPTFQYEYVRFWIDPEGTPLSWLALLYAMMSLAVLEAYGAGEHALDTRSSPIDIVYTYRGYCGQCLALSNYASPGPYTLESLLIYMEGEFGLSKDDQVHCYLSVGVAVRIALRMGLHRDSSKVGGSITPFQSEMRRRVWHFLVQVDLLASFHIGLPSMVHAIESDTLQPGNYRDEDLSENLSALPPPRPDTERTSMSYTIWKSRICIVFGKVAAQANRLTLPPYDEIMDLDRELRQAYDKVPEFLRMKTMELSVVDSAELIIQRFSVELLYHKSFCVLHRQFLVKAWNDARYQYSKKAVLESSIQLLRCQEAINEAFKPGRPLSRDKWFHSSLSMHDFLLAATIVYLIIVHTIETATAMKTSPGAIDHQYQDIADALEKSYAVWMETRTVSSDSKKASDILGIMLKRIDSMTRFGHQGSLSRPTIDGIKGMGGSSIMSQLTLNDQVTSNVQTYHFASTDPWHSGTFDETTTSSGHAMQLDPTLVSTEPLGAMIDMPTLFDWDIFDSHVRPQLAAGQNLSGFDFDDMEFGDNDNYYTL